MKQLKIKFLKTNMDIDTEIEQLSKKIQKATLELEVLKAKRNDLVVKKFYENKGLNFGQHFIYKGKRIIKVFAYNEMFLNGYYMTKKGIISERPISIYIKDDVGLIL